jgi:hypothetical protein
MAARRRGRKLYRGKSGARTRRSIIRRYERQGESPARARESYGRIVGKVAREQAARRRGGVKVERVRSHGSHSRTGTPERVRGHTARVRADPPGDPYSPRAKYRHQEVERASDFSRVRTVKVGDHEVRVGFRRDGSAGVVSILHPRGEERPGGRGRSVRHRHSFGEHAGACGPDCRAGRVSHRHVRPYRPRRRRR